MDSDKPKLSVIMPVYNAERYVGEAIESILNQTYVNFELIIADDGSIDYSRKIVEKYSSLDKRIVVFNSQINKGKVATVNFLLQFVKGKYVTIHDADDISHPMRFESQISFLERNQDYAMCGTNYISFRKNKVLFKSNLQTDWNEIRNLIKSESQFHGPTVIFKKEILDEVGGLYRSYFTHGEDMDFTLRVVEKYKSTNLENYLYFYRLVGTSLTKKACYFNEGRFLNTRLIFHLAGERRFYGKDSIMKDDIIFLNRLLDEWGKNLFADSSHALRLGASHTLGQLMHRNSIILSWYALRKDPLNILNFRCLFYCLRKTYRNFIFEFFTSREKVTEYLASKNVPKR